MSAAYAVERRNAQRYGLALPIQVVRISDREVEVEGKTRNLSSAGAYFEMSGRRPSPGSPIEFVVTLQQGVVEEKVQLHCRGRVTRTEKLASGERFGVAATIDRYQFQRQAMN